MTHTPPQPDEAALTKRLLAFADMYAPCGDNELIVAPDARQGLADVLREAAAALATALQSISGAEGWQPIESAPKDGTLLIGFVPNSALYEVIFIRRWPDDDFWMHDMANEAVAMDVEPTHWMPLPPPPAAEKE